jgi:cation transport protein ChaC
MRLTAAHVAKMAREVDDPGPMPGFEPCTDDDFRRLVAEIIARAPDPKDIWVFGYGSLIWKPAFEASEFGVGVVRGWHRSFCLGWNTRFRGSVEAPGLMLALDRGGSCKGVIYRLQRGAIETSLRKLVEREMPYRPNPFPPRWVRVETAAGARTALTFVIDRTSGRYVSGLNDSEIAAVLARAVGHRGSMAEYLHATVEHLERMGIHDRHLWRLQELVAERIEADHPGDD